MDISFRRAKNSKFVFFFFFFLYREISNILEESLSLRNWRIWIKEKKKKEEYSHVKTNRNRATLYKLKSYKELSNISFSVQETFGRGIYLKD